MCRLYGCLYGAQARPQGRHNTSCAEAEMGTLFALKNLLKSGRLALRLVRDDRVPNYAKLIAALALLYAVSPLDLVPDWIPVFGQMDDFAVLAAAVTLFVRLCPPEIVEEH